MSKFRWPIAALAGLFTVGLIALIWLANLPLPELSPPAESSQVLAADGRVIASLHGEQNRRVVNLEQISPNLINAVIAAEDRSFFDHGGYSLRGIIRAARANWQSGEIIQGGSTLTQQYVRNTFPGVGTKRTFGRKLKETFWAVQLERRMTKEEILQRYLNAVYFGRGAYGAEAAARTYFKVSAADLSVGQSAYLAGIMPAPQRHQIDQHPQRALTARNSVIAKMQEAGFIDEGTAGGAREEDLAAQFKPGQTIEVDSSRAGYFVEHVRRLLKSDFGLSDDQILRGGLDIHTTLDLRMQDAAEAAVRSVLDEPTDPEAALVAMDPQGRVRAMVGGRDVDSIQRARGFNFAVNPPGGDGGRQAGSAFKPIALAAFVDEGKSVHSTYSGRSSVTLRSDECKNADGSPWRVSNYGHSGYGFVDIVSATTSSINTVYAQMMDEVVSPAKFVRMASRLGIDIPAHDTGCALALGTSAVTPMEMAEAYTTFAQGGVRPAPLLVERIVLTDGQIFAQRSPVETRAIEPNVADTVNYVLERNIRSGTGTRARIGRPAAGKTGTTDNFQDAWFAGYTPELTAVVWMGYAPDEDGTIPLMTNVRGRSVSGGSFPASVWAEFMTRALEGIEASDFHEPELGGEVIRHRPQPPRIVEIPELNFPPCFPFCSVPDPRENPGRGRGRSIFD
ncbi:MAG: transglycosylase domain-containing protein [Actinomycetota bacterium]